ncbi:hypothetical protein [Exiguobacterium sp. BG5(2022)]|uniref:hypothetical protein n=1 Tax=Exiguobacterium sp. BG5(2022) TaxID=2962595 RepID=UPI0028828E50|nr:hypothetical protein [Exiguobacterium sp. BG5(2022)]MDT0193656.1 hypothetical protein [Exiguobacterium sp. BG5(2022)]
MAQNTDHFEKCENCTNRVSTYNYNPQTIRGNYLCKSCVSSYEVCARCGLHYKFGETNGAYCQECDD